MFKAEVYASPMNGNQWTSRGAGRPVKILDETRMSLSMKEERLIYINVPRRNTYESRDEIISI